MVALLEIWSRSGAFVYYSGHYIYHCTCTALCSRLIDRVLSGAVTRWKASNHHTQKLSYVDFVWFIISEEDKKSQTRLVFGVSWKLSSAKSSRQSYLGRNKVIFEFDLTFYSIKFQIVLLTLKDEVCGSISFRNCLMFILLTRVQMTDSLCICIG